MKSQLSEVEQRVLLLLKLDAKNLFNRIKERKIEYITVFAVKRTKDHFASVFKNRYSEIDIQTLKHCSLDVLQAVDDFYTYVDEIYWYLKHTEDMPNTVSDELDRSISKLETLHATLALYVDADLGIGKIEEPIENFTELIPEEDSH